MALTCPYFCQVIIHDIFLSISFARLVFIMQKVLGESSTKPILGIRVTVYTKRLFDKEEN